jgi:hypothetical protein
MDVYLLMLCLGFGGLLLMSLVGLSHQHSPGGQSQGHAHGHGHSHGHGGDACNGHSHHGVLSSRGHQHAASRVAGIKMKGTRVFRDSRSANLFLMLISPRVIFSLLFGFGAVGTVLNSLAAHWPVFVLPLVAVFGAWVFEWYAVQPLWRVLFGFASTPAQTLESIVLEEGQAVTNFDASGTGLIVVDLDGQVRQLLGKLTPEELAADATRVRSGDRVFIRAVDPRRNSCTVSRLN